MDVKRVTISQMRQARGKLRAIRVSPRGFVFKYFVESHAIQLACGVLNNRAHSDITDVLTSHMFPSLSELHICNVSS